MSTTLGVKLDEATQQRLKAIAKALDRAPHWVLKTALTQFLDREEAFQREREEDERRWQHYMASGQAIDQERVLQWLDALAAGHDQACPK